MLERKGLGIRFGAALIDGIILAIVVNVLVLALGTIGYILAGLASLAYPGIEILKAASPGKMALKLKVVSEDGTPATRDQLVQRALLRWLGTFVGGLMLLVATVVPILAGLGNFAVAVIMIVLLVLSWKTLQATRQGFWDVRARTAVVGPAAAVPVAFTGAAPPPPPVA